MLDQILNWFDSQSRIIRAEIILAIIAFGYLLVSPPIYAILDARRRRLTRRQLATRRLIGR